MVEDAHLKEAGIHCLTLETPYPVGTVNVWVVEGNLLTLIDCGARAAVSRASLEAGLSGLGYALREVGLLLLTHQHVDHLGLAGDLAREFDLEIGCLSVLADYVERWEEACGGDEEFRVGRMRRHGVPEHVVADVEARGATRLGEASASRVHHRLADRDEIELGSVRLRALHRPGHSPSDTLFLDESSGIAIVGDHLLGGISSNALMSRSLVGDSTPFRPLLEYRRSLRKTRELDIRVMLTGHGAPIVDHRTLIDTRLAAQEGRAARLLDSLRRAPRQTVWQLAVDLFGDEVTAAQPMLCFSETIGHLEYLEDEGCVVSDRDMVSATFAPVV